MIQKRVAQWLESKPRFFFVVFSSIAAFSAYLSMYAFRKPLSASDYNNIESLTLFGTEFDFKAIALISQLLGYMTSKFLGVKFASEAPFARRAPRVLGLIAFAGLMLIMFAITPAPYNLIFLFFNGLPLGMVWSMLFGILEGRRVTEFLGLAMSISVIFASGWVKAVGLWTIQSLGVPEFWMPAFTGGLFIPLLLFSLALLFCLPPPDEQDIAQRTARAPMSRNDRRRFFKDYSWGVVALVGSYVCLITYRGLRDDFMDLILADLGYKLQASDFAGIETRVGLVVIVVLCSLWFFKSNRFAVWSCMGLIAIGSIITGVSTVLMQNGTLGPKAFFIVNGIGLYIAYVPLQSILLDRLLASLETVATAAFLIAVADAFGYVSIVCIYLTKNVYLEVTDKEINWAQLLICVSYVVAFVVPIGMAFCAFYFDKKHMDLQQKKASVN